MTLTGTGVNGSLVVAEGSPGFVAGQSSYTVSPNTRVTLLSNGNSWLIVGKTALF